MTTQHQQRKAPGIEGVTRTTKPTEEERRDELLKRKAYRKRLNSHMLAAGMALQQGWSMERRMD